MILLLCYACLQIGNAQDYPNKRDSLTTSHVDTTTIIATNWEVLKQQYQLGDTTSFYSGLVKHQALVHQYGFRFDQQFEDKRLNFKYRQLFDELFILEAPSDTLAIETILSPEYQAQFVGNHSDITPPRSNFQAIPVPMDYNVKSTYWVKLNAVNTQKSAQEAWLMVGWNKRSWENIEVYQDDGEVVKKIGHSGLRKPVAEKMVADWRNFVQLKVPPGRQYTYYFKLTGVFFPKYPERISFYYFDATTYWSKKSFALFEDGVFLGITMLLILIVLLLYYYDNTKDTLFFLIQLIGVWIHDFADSEGAGSSHFFYEVFPGCLAIGHLLAILGFLMMTYGGVLFPIVFLEVKKYAPKLRKWTLYLLYLILGLYLSLGLFNIFLYKYATYPYDWIADYLSFFVLVLIAVPFFILAIGVSAWQEQHPLAKIYGLAYLPLVLIFLIRFGGFTFFNTTISTEVFQLLFRVAFASTYFLFTAAIFYKRQMERREILEKRLELKIQLEQEQQEAQRLKELDTFKTRLYTNLTHEFRTPLTVILGLTKDLVNLPKQALTKAVTVIERNGESLLQLINQLLDLSKLENNSLQLNLQQSDIIPFLRYITESFQSYANTQNLSLQFHTTLERLEMDFAPQQTTQIMANLLSNALKFTPSEGAINVSVSTDEEYIIIKVTDTGTGISAAKLPHIFDRFYQVDDSHTRTREGTGIGLAHTKEMIKLMGGTINVESKLGIGTIFLVKLKMTKEAPVVPIDHFPISAVANRHPQLIVQQQPISSQKTNHTDDLPQILIIEDNPDVVFYLKSCLAPHYELTIAYNGRIGIEKALATIPDIIISDVMMPDKDGYEVCQTLKEEERTSHIPIILLTAKADMDSKHTGFSKGADAYLTKPFDKSELMIRLQQMIQKKERMLAFLSKPNQIVGLQETPAPTVKAAILVEDAFLQKVRQLVETHYEDENFALPQLCQKIGMSRSQLFRKMKALINVSPSKFIRDYRMQQAKLLLETGEWNVSEVTYRVGLKDISHFSRIFQETFGYPPSLVGKNTKSK